MLSSEEENVESNYCRDEECWRCRSAGGYLGEAETIQVSLVARLHSLRDCFTYCFRVEEAVSHGSVILGSDC